MAAALRRTCPSEEAEAVSFKLWQHAVILYWGVCVCVCAAVQGAEAGKRGVRNAGSWHFLSVIPEVSPSEASRCWKAIKTSTRKLLSQGKSISTSKKSAFSSIRLSLIYAAFTSKKLRYYPGSPISLFNLTREFCFSLSQYSSVCGKPRGRPDDQNGAYISIQIWHPNKHQ